MLVKMIGSFNNLLVKASVLKDEMALSASIAKDELGLKLTEAKVKMEAEIEKQKKELGERKDKDIAKYLTLYPELFDKCETEKELAAALFSAKKKAYIEGKDVEVKTVIEKETVPQMLARIKKQND